MAAVLMGVGVVLTGLAGAVWTSRRTDRLRDVDPRAAQRIEEARFFRGR
ncbi:MAG: hypothetical protein ACXVGH_13900 [Mycobacteriales bacterium]